MREREQRTAERLASLLEGAGISRDTFASMIGREGVTIQRYLTGGVISKNFCLWLDRVESLHVYEGGVEIKVRMPLIRRVYKAKKLPVTVVLPTPLKGG